MLEWTDDDEMLFRQQGVNAPFRALMWALPVCLVFWIVVGLIVWAVFAS